MEKNNIQNAGVNDYKELIPLVIAFEQSLMAENGKIILSPKEIQRSKRYLKKYLADNKSIYLIYKYLNQIIGYSFLSIEDEKDGFGCINELFVVPAKRKQGIGNLLLQSSIRWFKEKGCKKIQLTVHRQNEAAINLYKKIGFSLGDYLDMQLKF